MSQKPRAPASKGSFRKLHGILLFDKPHGLSSNQALQRVRHLFRADKAGHTGSLDPLATGLLPICFGEATKIAGGLLGARKAYDTVARLGMRHRHRRRRGQLLRERPVPPLTIDTIDAALRTLPAASASARRSIPRSSAAASRCTPRRAAAKSSRSTSARSTCMRSNCSLPPTCSTRVEPAAALLRLHIECGSGTYVRSLVRDLGELLGCGAHVAELRRLWVDPFRDPRMWTLEALQALAERGERSLDACLLPIETGMTSWPQVTGR